MMKKTHWETVYSAKQSSEVSWFQPEPARSLERLRALGSNSATSIIDIGGGDSTLVDRVISGNLGRMTVLDISGAALARARGRLGPKAIHATWMEADITTAELPLHAFDVWHDRAVFHFLTDPIDRARYVASAEAALRSEGHLIVATFALNGPARCSGLDVQRYDAEGLVQTFGDAFVLQESFADLHHTPSGAEQWFTFAIFKRI